MSTKEQGKNCNWILGTNFHSNLEKEINNLSQKQLRSLLFNYCNRYHEIYNFERLDEAFLFIEMQIESLEDEFENELPQIKEEVEYAMGEYCFSLNEIASALYRLLDKKELSFDCSVKIINHVWEAYSCNEKPEHFMDREDLYLCKMLNHLV